MSDDRIHQRRVLASAIGVLGIGGYTLTAHRYATPLFKPIILASIACTTFGIGYAAALLAAPEPRSARIRELAAGAAAGWLAFDLAGLATLFGLAPTTDGFRVVWAPTVEEIAKGIMLAAVLQARDSERSRSELVTWGLTVGVGFAIRENFVYYGNAVGTGSVYLEWVLVRALPPVLAHAAFGMIQGGILAHAAVQSRVTSSPLPRFSILGVIVAIIVHITYNFVTLLCTKANEEWVGELVMLWSLSAVATAAILRKRTLTLSALDTLEPRVSMAPEFVEENPRTFAYVLLGIWCVFAAIPVVASHFVAEVFAPAAIGLAGCALVSSRVQGGRFLVPWLLGIGVRPLLRVGEEVFHYGVYLTRGVSLAPIWGLLSNLWWLGVIAHTTRAVRGKHGAGPSITFAAAMSAGMIASYLGGTFAVAGSVNLRNAVMAVVRYLPRSFALAALVGLVGFSSTGNAWRAAILAAGIAVLWENGLRLVPSVPAALVLNVLLSVGLLVFVMRQVPSKNKEDESLLV